MEVKKLLQSARDYPPKLSHISSPPKQIYVKGHDLQKLLARPCVAIVGSRKVTSYGRQVTSRLAGELARQGVTIISGLALGVDAVAHRAALEANGATIAVLPCPLERIHPAGHRSLADHIVQQGGVLLTEYGPGCVVNRGNFIARNRIVSALSDAVLITEAAEKSGTLHTAQFALEQGKEVLAVPGNIISPTSAGTNNLLKAGATPVTASKDVLRLFGLEPQASTIRRGDNPQEQLLLDLLQQGLQDGAALLERSGLETAHFNQTLTMLEITGKIRPLGNNCWSVH